MGILILPFSDEHGALGGDPDLTLREIKARCRALFGGDAERTCIEVGQTLEGARRMFVGEFLSAKDRHLPAPYRWKKFWGSAGTFLEAIARAKENLGRGTPEEEVNRPQPQRVIDNRHGWATDEDDKG